MAKYCAACGKKIGAFAEWQSTKNSCICMSCYEKLKPYRSDPSVLDDQQVKESFAEVERNAAIVSSFDSTDRIGQKFECVAMFDNAARVVLLPKRLSTDEGKQNFWAFSYDDIVSAELLQNERRVSANGLARAVVGGALLGGIGAIAGMASAQDARANAGTSSIEVSVAVRNYIADSYKVTISKGGMNVEDPKYATFLTYGIELTNRLNDIAGYIEQEEEQEIEEPAKDGISEIRRYKELLDEGIITPEEFQQKKAELLGL